MIGLLLVPTDAAAIVRATTLRDVEMRGGPGPQYEPLATIPRSATVRVETCILSPDWCRILWGRDAGWVPGSALGYGEPPLLVPNPYRNDAASGRNSWPNAGSDPGSR